MAVEEEDIDYERDPWGGHSRDIIAEPNGGHHEEGGCRELATAPLELKDNEDPSSSEASTISTVPCLAP
jgi:hypothetical protein